MTAGSPPMPYWINTAGLIGVGGGNSSRMAIVPCPAGGHHLPGEMRALQAQGIETLVSLLSPEEIRVLKLEAEGRNCREVGIDYRWLPVADHSIPESMDEFRMVLDQLQHDLRAGRGVGAHCFAGIGRSCLLMACLLCLEGLAPEEAFRRLSEARGVRVPDTWLQTQWVEHFAESLERSSGSL